MRVLLSLLLLVGCTSDPDPVTPASPVDIAYPYAGYPKVVGIDEVPEPMRSSLDGDQAVAIAPGVWTQYIEGLDLRQVAKDGAYVGYCAAVEQARDDVGNASGSTCW